MELKNIEEILGGFEYLKVNISNNLDLITLTKKGISKRSLKFFGEAANFKINDFASMLPISVRTIQRYKNTQRFPTEVSEKILQLAKIFTQGREVFGDDEKFLSWLNEESFAMGGKKPKELLDTTFGYDMVENELGRIEHGILS